LTIVAAEKKRGREPAPTSSFFPAAYAGRHEVLPAQQISDQFFSKSTERSSSGTPASTSAMHVMGADVHIGTAIAK
jgi:hypothetical protein